MLKPVKHLNKEFANYEFVTAERYRELSDEEVIEKILEGQKSLFEVIMRRYNQRLFRIQHSYINDEDAVQDTLQMTYIKVYENLRSFRGDAKFSTWITRIAINEALKYIQNEKKYLDLHKVGEFHSTNAHVMNNKQSPEKETIQKDLRHLLEKTVNDLPTKYRTVYMMREIEQLTTKEVAECVGITKSNVKVRLHRAKKMLRKKLERRVATTDIFNFLGMRCDRVVFRVMKSLK
jgi:RNA polymerase sigma-70 factor (ECF subfamily)